MELTTLLREQQIGLLHKRTPAVLFISVIVATGLALTVWVQNNSTLIFSWLLLVYAFLVIRVITNKYIIPPARNKPIGQHTAKIYILMSGMSGLVWASCPLFALPETLVDTLPIAIVLCCMMAGSVSGLSYVRMVYVAYVVPVTFSVVLSLFVLGDRVSLIIGVLIVFYMFACMYFGNSFNRVVVESLRLQHENRELLEDLKTQRDIAEKASVDKSRFLAVASHDMRQPLHTLSLFMDIVKTAESDQEREEFFQKIDLSLGALNDLFNALLDISKLDAGVVEPKFSNFYLSDILDEVMHEFEAEAQKKNLRMLLRNHNDLAVYSDRFLITRVLRNLIGNALKYTQQGGILVACRQRQNHVLLQIWDTGIGISEDNLSEIFLEFKQLHNPQRDRTQGLGLGLAIVERLCHLMQYELSVRSQPGKGSVFSLRLPIGVEQAAEHEVIREQSSGMAQIQLNVLVIDDELLILEAMQALLQRWGCQVITADSLSDALLQLDETNLQPELVLADMRLRDGETGIEAINAIKEKYGLDIPGVLITGDTAVERISLVQESGYKVLHKPVNPVQMRMLVNRYANQTAESMSL
ncbi:hybrid sensor histidine kinase/response regulator [Gammaproteobacteria bacterium]|nr:hybrid sensor histidine kinase/response regulator [Gammaproteobacteria bacterium]